MMTTRPSLPLAALAVAFLVGACNHEATEPEIGTGDDLDTPATLLVKPLVISANAVGGTPSVDTAFTRGPMFATLRVANPHGAEVGHLDVTVEYEFSELSDSVDFVAPGVYRLADPELLKVAQRGTVTVRVAPAGTGRAEVLLGIPRPLTEMSATRFFLLTGADVTALRTVAPDSLNAAALIRTATNERTESKLNDFSHLGIVYSGLVIP